VIRATGAGVNLVVENCYFNAQGTDKGGAIYINDGAYVKLDNCDFEGCSAQHGAALAIEGAISSLDIYNSKFHGARGNWTLGGAMYISAAKVYCYNTKIYDNVMGGEGGACYVQNAGELVMEYCAISGNNAGNGGGGIFMNGSGNVVNLKNCTMSGNSSEDWSGSGGLNGGGDNEVVLDNSVVTGNNGGDANLPFDGENTVVGDDYIVDTAPEADCQPNCVYEDVIDPDEAVTIDTTTGDVSITLPTETTDPNTGETITIPVPTDDEGNPSIGSGDAQSNQFRLTDWHILTDSIVCNGDTVRFSATVKNEDSQGNETYTYRLLRVTQDTVYTVVDSVLSRQKTETLKTPTLPASVMEIYVAEVSTGDKTSPRTKRIRVLVIPNIVSGKINHSKNTANE
jgi:hypothetical protein